MLQVCLSIQILCLNIANALRQRWGEDKDVCWEEWVFIYLHKTSNLQVFRFDLSEVTFTSGDSLDKLIVFFIVLTMTSGIFNQVFDHRGDHDKNDWQNGSSCTVVTLQIWDRETLHDSQDEEIGVSELAELYKQIKG